MNKRERSNKLYILATSVSEDYKDKFEEKCRINNLKPSEALRELIHGYLENRLTIVPALPTNLRGFYKNFENEGEENE